MISLRGKHDPAHQYDMDRRTERQRERRCRVCGCTDDNACVHAEHGPCWWIEDDLCSHCGEPEIVAGDHQAMLERVRQGGPAITLEEIEAWATRARAALDHLRLVPDLFEL